VDAFTIGAKRGDHVAMRVLAREGVMLDVDFDVAAAGVSARASSRLRTGDIERFRDSLRALDEGGDVPADLVTGDRALRVRVARGGGGVFVAQCFAQPSSGGGTILKVVVTLSGVELAELLWALDGVARDVSG
jgi:hypothetical protein